MSEASDSAHLERWRRRLVGVCLFFAVMSASWVLLGSFDPLGFYNRQLARTLFGAGSLGPLAGPAFAFGVGLLGAASAAFFVLMAFVVEHAFPARWAYQGVWASITTWFVLDTAMSLYVGAVFNVAFVNLPCLVALGVPLLLLRRHTRDVAPT